MRTEFYRFADVLKATEGGTPQWMVKEQAADLGLMIQFGSSPYVGMYGIHVKSENKRTLRRFARRIGV